MSTEKTNVKKKPTDQNIEKFVSDNLLKEDEGKVIIVREGAAPRQLDVIKPNKVHLTGVIGAPAEFYSKRKELHNPNKCHVLYDKRSGKITLVIDEQYENDNYKVIGQLTANPDLEPFRINGSSTFGIKELMKVLKFNRTKFVDKEENEKIVAALLAFNATVNQVFTDVSDNRGSDEQAKITKVEHALQESFKLKIPMYKGAADVVFKVDICVSATSGSVELWLESRDLKDLQDTSMNDIIDENLKVFSKIVCIEQ